MTDLPGQPIDPLQPAPGAYDAVARRARGRRSRSALLAGGLALVLGTAGVGLATLTGSSTTAGDDRLGPASAPPTFTTGPAPSSSPSPPQATSPVPATQSPSPAASPTAKGAPPPAAPRPTESSSTVLGLVVDAAGRPLPGVHVYLLSVNAFPPRSPDATTDAQGRFTVGCRDDRKALLSAWPLGARQSATTRNLAPVFVGGATSWSSAAPLRCGEVTTTMPVGATLEGSLARETADGGTEPLADHEVLPDGVYSDELDVQGSIIATWDPVGGRYRWTGLPAGSVLVSDGPNHGKRMVLRAGEVRTEDWVVPCRCTSPSPAPSPTPV